ncbi:hypothetical protein [Actinomyces succiniciruminis]|uniref:Uncharacterized protein n=1 Tax=Actinomyces succiniciruminis TaxID=1522002 RepID=A0A1L7RRU0_9ACTO|nr:hypothetical protein [Actinomyces succiniciruminis]CED92452.1 Hypothetical protein AAM4_2620 [Actinomyces succiniciruminis]
MASYPADDEIAELNALGVTTAEVNMHNRTPRQYTEAEVIEFLREAVEHQLASIREDADYTDAEVEYALDIAAYIRQGWDSEAR